MNEKMMFFHSCVWMRNQKLKKKWNESGVIRMFVSFRLLISVTFHCLWHFISFNSHFLLCWLFSSFLFSILFKLPSISLSTFLTRARIYASSLEKAKIHCKNLIVMLTIRMDAAYDSDVCSNWFRFMNWENPTLYMTDLVSI